MTLAAQILFLASMILGPPGLWAVYKGPERTLVWSAGGYLFFGAVGCLVLGWALNLVVLVSRL